VFEKGSNLIFSDDDECAECPAIIQELENIDDEADAFGIDFVKLNDEEAAKKYNVLNTPSLAYFRKKIPLIYEGKRVFWFSDFDR